MGWPVPPADLSPREVVEWERAAASRYVSMRAENDDDAVLLLDALGLLPAQPRTQ